MTSSTAIAAMPTVKPHRRQLLPSLTLTLGLTPVSLNLFDFSPLLVVTRREPGLPGVTLVTAQPAIACSPAVSPLSPSLCSGGLSGLRFFEETPLVHGLSLVKQKEASAPYFPFFCYCFG